MKESTVESYIPEAIFREGKEELACRECHEDFALVDPLRRYRILSARGLRFKHGQKLVLPAKEKTYLESVLRPERRVAIQADAGILIVFGELMEVTGLLPLILPEGDVGRIAQCLPLLDRKELFCSPSLSGLSPNGGSAEECYAMLNEQFSILDRILRPERDIDFRLHCARIAGFAGCRVNVTALPAGVLPVSRADLLRWTAFLLCMFLALRGESAGGPVLNGEPGTGGEYRIQLTHAPERRSKSPYDGNFDFMNLPCFSGYTLTKTAHGLLVETALHRTGNAPLLMSPAPEFAEEWLCLEILYPDAG